MTSLAVLLLITVATFIGDYSIKLASSRSNGLTSATFLAGAILYGMPAIGWFFLMKNHSLAAIGVLYSASSILMLAGLGFFVFKESLGLREGIGIGLAICSVLAMSYKS